MILFTALILVINFNLVVSSCKFGYISDEAKYYCYQNDTFTENERNILKPPYVTEDNDIIYEFDYERDRTYELSVKIVADVKDEKNCNNTNFRTQLHSKYLYKTSYNKTAGYPICSKKGTIIIKHITTGCYKLELSANDIIIKDENIFINNTKKQNFRGHNPEIYIQTIESSSISLEINHPFLQDHPILSISIQCTSCQNVTYAIFRIAPTTNGNVTQYNLFCSHNSTNIIITCKPLLGNSTLLNCVVSNLIEGEYTIDLRFKNIIRCPLALSYWPFCTWQISSSISWIMPTEAVTYANSSIEFSKLYYSIIVIICICIFATVVFFAWKYKNKIHTHQRILTASCSYDKEKGETNPILLLYAKDIDIVMNTISCFRKVLQVEGFQVYDIYDPEQQVLLNENGERWITDKLMDKSTKMIIIETYCGHIIAEPSYSVEKLYKKPTCYDNLFPFALSLIRAKLIESDINKKLFMVKMGFDQIEYTQFNFFNPFIRYSLPYSFTELIRDMHNLKYSAYNSEHIDKELQEFCSMYKKMKIFIQDLMYLTEILNITISKSGNKIDIQHLS